MGAKFKIWIGVFLVVIGLSFASDVVGWIETSTLLFGTLVGLISVNQGFKEL